MAIRYISNRWFLAGVVGIALAATAATAADASEYGRVPSRGGANAGAAAVGVNENTAGNSNFSPSDADSLSNAQQGISINESVENDNDTDNNVYTYVQGDLPEHNPGNYSFSTQIGNITTSAQCPTDGWGISAGSFLGGLSLNFSNNDLPEACATAQQEQIRLIDTENATRSAARLGDHHLEVLDDAVWAHGLNHYGISGGEARAAVALHQTLNTTTEPTPEVIQAEEERLEELLIEGRF